MQMPEDTVSAQAKIDSVNATDTTEALVQDSLQTKSAIDTSNSTTSVAQKNETDTSSLDSIRIKNYQDSLLSLEQERIHLHENTAPDTQFNPYNAELSEIFTTDGTAPSEFLHDNPLFVQARFALSSNINRALYYGNTAPINKLKLGSLLYSGNSHLFSGTDLFSSTLISRMYIDNRGTIRFSTFPDAFTVPEAVAFWENGLFDENILNLRFTRMISRQVSVSVFSTFRHFDRKEFDHKGQNIYNFYSSMFDSLKVMNKGYNPLTDEHTVGANAIWKAKNGNRIDASFLYGDLSNEIAINSTFDTSGGLPPHALVNRYPLHFGARYSGKLYGNFYLDLDGAYKDEPIIYIAPEIIEDKTTPVRKKGMVKDVEGSIRSGVEFNDDSLGITIDIKRNQKRFFDDKYFLGWQNRYEAFYSPKFNLGKFRVSSDLGGGCALIYWEKEWNPVSVGHAGLSIKQNNHEIRAFFDYDYIPFPISMDSMSLDQSLTDQYFRTGAEYVFNWKAFGILLGYQYVRDIDPMSVVNYWPSGSIPYEQPQSVFVIAPSFNWNGINFNTSAMISDSKPFVKSHTKISYTAHPTNTHEYLEFGLLLDYWSERDSIYFANTDDWNNQIYNLGIELAAHIKSFRIFYKVDNLLNLKYAYVPGYYTSGLTFRWGFNWFIQK
ncbi:MAG: hypothetical protein Q4F84_02020 [Fibrobacter sp.]|nr:hypothetical protein [Fibrobacter sp.]